MRPLRAAIPAALALALLGAATARADQQVVAAPVDRYVNPDVTIAPGEALSFANQDPIAPHNLTARDTDAVGNPIFGSATISGGGVAPVVGAAALAPGEYAFYCTIHPTLMNGTLTVAGDRVAPDTTRPVLRARVDSGSLNSVDERRALLTTLFSSEPVTGSVTLRAFGQTIARRTVSLGSGATAVVLKLTSKGARGVRRRSRVRLALSVVAADGAGNTGAASTARTLRHKRR